MMTVAPGSRYYDGRMYCTCEKARDSAVLYRVQAMLVVHKRYGGPILRSVSFAGFSSGLFFSRSFRGILSCRSLRGLLQQGGGNSRLFPKF